jgi:hypothetical protein
MAVRADLGLRRGIEEIEPVPERRQRIAVSGSFSSKVAVSARTGKGAAKSSTACVRPTQSRSFSSDIVAFPRFACDSATGRAGWKEQGGAAINPRDEPNLERLK